MVFPTHNYPSKYLLKVHSAVRNLEEFTLVANAKASGVLVGATSASGALLVDAHLGGLTGVDTAPVGERVNVSRKLRCVARNLSAFAKGEADGAHTLPTLIVAVLRAVIADHQGAGESSAHAVHATGAHVADSGHANRRARALGVVESVHVPQSHILVGEGRAKRSTVWGGRTARLLDECSLATLCARTVGARSIDDIRRGDYSERQSDRNSKSAELGHVCTL